LGETRGNAPAFAAPALRQPSGARRQRRFVHIRTRVMNGSFSRASSSARNRELDARTRGLRKKWVISVAQVAIRAIRPTLCDPGGFAPGRFDDDAGRRTIRG